MYSMRAFIQGICWSPSTKTGPVVDALLHIGVVATVVVVPSLAAAVPLLLAAVTAAAVVPLLLLLLLLVVVDNVDKLEDVLMMMKL